eukprot:1139324-Pelagomonas_calceolata.AAC.8
MDLAGRLVLSPKGIKMLITLAVEMLPTSSSRKRRHNGTKTHELEHSTDLVLIIISETVRREARAQFDCQELEGAAFEDEGGVGSADAHWCVFALLSHLRWNMNPDLYIRDKEVQERRTGEQWGVHALPGRPHAGFNSLLSGTRTSQDQQDHHGPHGRYRSECCNSRCSVKASVLNRRGATEDQQDHRGPHGGYGSM